MSFLGKIGQSLGIGDLTHKPLKALEAIVPTVAGYALGGPVGAGLGNALGQKIQGKSFLGSAEGGLETFGLATGAEALPGLASNASSYLSNLTSAPSAAASSNLAAGSDALLPQAGDAGLAQVPNINLAAQGGQLIPSGGDALTTGAGNLTGSLPGASGVTGSGLTAGLNGGDAAVASSQGIPTIGSQAASIAGKLGDTLKGLPGKALDSLAANPLQTAVSGLSLLNNNSTAKQIGEQEKVLQAQAAQTNAQVQPLLNSLTTGQLPAGAQSLIDQQTQSEITQIKNKYAQMGLSGSTMEQQEISAAGERAQSQVFTIAQQMASTGLQALGASSGISQNLLNQLMAEDKDASTAIGGLGSALAGGGADARTITLRAA